MGPQSVRSGRALLAVRMNSAAIESTEFLQRVRPALERRDADALAEAVSTRWTSVELCWLMREGTADARKVVCLTLGLVGDMSCAGCLADGLHDADAQFNRLAEHALWSIWFRAGSGRAMPHFKRGVAALNEGRYADSLDGFHAAVEADPGFAEAFNQCGIAHYLLEQWDEALADCREATQLAGTHFGAWAGMGHCHAHLDDLPAAAECYRRALEINPRMPAVAAALTDIERRAKPA